METLITIAKVLFDTTSLNYLFAYSISLLMIVDISLSFKREIDFRSSIISLGVLGTFVGIFIGLQNFNINSIEESIPPLLSGLKTAFVTSIYGMFIAILLTIFKPPLLRSFKRIDTSKDTKEILIDILHSFKNHEELNRNLIEELQKIRVQDYHNFQDIKATLEKIETKTKREDMEEFLKLMQIQNENLNDLKLLGIKEVAKLEEVEKSSEKVAQRLEELKVNVYYGS